MPKKGHRSPSQVQVEVGNRIRAIRLVKGISQRELARRVGSDPASLSKLEGGQRAATVASLDALARALGVEIADFLSTSTASAPPSSESERIWLRLEGKLRGRPSAYNTSSPPTVSNRVPGSASIMNAPPGKRRPTSESGEAWTETD